MQNQFVDRRMCSKIPDIHLFFAFKCAITNRRFEICWSEINRNTSIFAVTHGSVAFQFIHLLFPCTALSKFTLIGVFVCWTRHSCIPTGSLTGNVEEMNARLSVHFRINSFRKYGNSIDNKNISRCFEFFPINELRTRISSNQI